MSGWLPFANQLETLLASGDEANGKSENPDSGRSSIKNDGRPATDYEEGPELAPGQRIIQFVRQDVMGFTSTTSQSTLSVPVWLGHGELDDLVSVDLGRRANGILTQAGWNVRWQSYDDLAHWYKPDELEDIVNFLHDVVGVPVSIPASETAPAHSALEGGHA